jgi:hypothetical protein
MTKTITYTDRGCWYHRDVSGWERGSWAQDRGQISIKRQRIWLGRIGSAKEVARMAEEHGWAFENRSREEVRIECQQDYTEFV